MPRKTESSIQDISLALFEEKQVRRLWYKDGWYFAVVDVIAVLSESSIPRRYWSDLKARIKAEGGNNELYEEIVQLRIRAADGKLRETDLADTRTLLRIIQSIPSPKAEMFKQWLAQVGEERATELDNPERAIERMRETYRSQGRSEEWINARVHNAVVRNELTDEWADRGAAEGREYAVLTNVINKNTFGVTISEHKAVKSLRNENLRDHETNLELALTTLGEATTAALHQKRDSKGFDALKEDAGEAGNIAGKSRREIEKTLGTSVVSPENFLKADQASKGSYNSLHGEEPAKIDSSGTQLSMFDETNNVVEEDTKK